MHFEKYDKSRTYQILVFRSIAMSLSVALELAVTTKQNTDLYNLQARVRILAKKTIILEPRISLPSDKAVQKAKYPLH